LGIKKGDSALIYENLWLSPYMSWFHISHRAFSWFKVLNHQTARRA